VNCKAKVSDLEDSILDEDLSRFDVAVHDVATGQVLEALEELTHQGPYFFFGKGSAFLEGFFETATFAELGDEVAVIGTFEDLHATYHVRMVQRPDDRDLLLQQFFQFLEGQRGQLDYLDGVGFIWVEGGVPVPSRTAR